MKIHLTPAAVALLLAPLVGNAQLVVTGSTDGTAMANDILGAGFTLVGTPTYVGGSNGPNQQGGFFSGGASAGITIDTGILLTSGTVQDAVGPNNSSQKSFNWGEAGYAPLTAFAGGASTFDANTLTFSFNAATSGQLFFNYVFGSEEYNEFVNDFNDVFGFFLDGTNIALLPGTSSPVSIDTVNVNVNPSDYINNALPGDPHPAPGPLANIQYDGFTVPLSVDANISAGMHTITLAIADTGDGNLDSGVFIEGGSFSTAPTPPGGGDGVPDGASTAALLGAALFGVSWLKRKIA